MPQTIATHGNAARLHFFLDRRTNERCDYLHFLQASD